MPGRNGRYMAVLRYVQEHPGCTTPQIGRGCGFNPSSTGLLAYMLKAGKLWRVGLKRAYRWYADRELALASEAEVIEATRRERAARDAATRLRSSLNRRARRHAAGARPMDEANKLLHGRLGKGVRVCPGVRVTIAPPQRGRYEAEPPQCGAISSDYLLRRQGVDIPSRYPAAFWNREPERRA